MARPTLLILGPELGQVLDPSTLAVYTIYLLRGFIFLPIAKKEELRRTGPNSRLRVPTSAKGAGGSDEMNKVMALTGFSFIGKTDQEPTHDHGESTMRVWTCCTDPKGACSELELS